MLRSHKVDSARETLLMTGLGVVAAWAAGVSPVAASTYQISGEGDTYFNLPPYTFQEGAIGKTANVPVSDSIRHDTNGTYPGQYHEDYDEFAAADQFGAHVSTTSNVLYTFAKGTSDYYIKYESEASAIVTIDDLIISGPAATGTTIPTAVHMTLEGSLTAAGQLNSGSPGVSASTSVSADLQFESQNLDSGSAGAGSTNSGAPVYSSAGWLSGYTGGSVALTSATFDAPINTPFTLQFELSADSTTFMNEDDTCSMIANTDFGDTFAFSTDQPVFTLPVGYTADSVSADIVANQFVALPEPGAVGLLAGMLVGGARRRRSPLT